MLLSVDMLCEVFESMKRILWYAWVILEFLTDFYLICIYIR